MVKPVNRHVQKENGKIAMIIDVMIVALNVKLVIPVRRIAKNAPLLTI